MSIQSRLHISLNELGMCRLCGDFCFCEIMWHASCDDCSMSRTKGCVVDFADLAKIDPQVFNIKLGICEACEKKDKILRSCSNCKKSFFIGEGICGNVCRPKDRVILNPIKKAEKCPLYKKDEEDRMVQCGNYKSILFRKEVAYD